MRLRRILLVQMLLCMCLYVGAYDRATYYSAAKGKKGAALKTALSGIIYRSSAVVSYSELHTAYQRTDVRADGKICDMYSCITNYNPSSPFASSYSREGDGFNREHTIPQSVFSERSPMVSDLHHVYPTDAVINGMRGSYCHGDVGTASKHSANNFCLLGAPSATMKANGCTESTVFEVDNQWKGDIARTYFYFVTCYETNLTSFSSFGAFSHNTYPSLTTWAQKCYLAWSELDQPDTWEIQRNENVYNYPTTAANNRNPFVDFPGLEQYIWGTYTNVAFDPDNYVNPYTGTTEGTGGGDTPGGDGGNTGGDTENPDEGDDTGEIIPGLIALRSSTITLDSFSKFPVTSGYQTVADYTISGYSGFSVENGMLQNSILQMKASTGKFTSPTVTSTAGYTVTINLTSTANCTLTTSDGQSATGNSTITVTSYSLSSTFTFSTGTKYATISSIVLTPLKTTLTAPEAGFASASLSLVVDDVATNTFTTNSDGEVTYSSSNTNVATVDEEGNVTAVGKGSATITAHVAATSTYAAATATYTVNVTLKEQTVSFGNASMTLKEGEKGTNAAQTTGDGEITYSSSNTLVATVNTATGEVTAVAEGEAVITATASATAHYDTATATYTVTVLAGENTDEPGDNNPGTVVGTYYTKMTTAPEDWSGEYLIVYEASGLAFNGALSTPDAVKNTISVTIEDDVIESSDEVDAAVFTISARTDGAYDIKSAAGLYIGNTSDANALKSSDATHYANTITMDEETGNVEIVSAKSHLSFNKATDQMRFRYYKSGSYTTQQRIVLYRKVEVTAPEVLRGDVNRDGRVSLADVTALIAYMLNGDSTTYDAEAADVDTNGTCDEDDVTTLVDMLLNDGM